MDSAVRLGVLDFIVLGPRGADKIVALLSYANKKQLPRAGGAEPPLPLHALLMEGCGHGTGQ